MAAPVLEAAFVSGELSPSLFGRVDTARYHSSAATMRNMFVSYRGGSYSRAGTAFIGYSKQVGRNFPPRIIPFQFSINQGIVLEFGHLYMRVIQNGSFVTETPLAVNAVSAGNPAVASVPNHNFSSGDWVYFAFGQNNVAGQIFVVGNVLSPTAFTLTDVFGNNINTNQTGFFAGINTVARIYTLPTPYSEQDLPYLKYVQSADVMSICCVNQISGQEYPPYDLARIANNNWTLTPLNFAPTIAAPSSIAGTSSASSASQGSTTTTGSQGGTSTTTLPQTTFYQYVATAISAVDGTESVASPIVYINNAYDMSATAASILLKCASVPGAASYNFYKAPPGYAEHVPPGSLFGFIGTSIAPMFVDSNVTPDLSQVPPVHKNPFARGTITGFTVTNQGQGYDSGTTSFNINTANGSGALLQAAPDDGTGALLSVIVEDGGKDYAPTDTVTVTGSQHTGSNGNPQTGSGATGQLTFGPIKGTYPSVVGYFQQRRVYASTQNNPDTYYMSQPGSYTNFDSRIPTIDADAITGTPWSLQVNGVQHLVSMPGGLLVLTGLGAWQVTGAGSYGANAQPITPSSQQAQPQAYNGISPTVPPIKIDFDILYVQAKGSIYRDISYNYYLNIYTGTDLTANSSHLFTGYKILEHAYTEEPNKVMWSVRSDGVLLSLTYLKTEQVMGWARHDTAGNFKSVCSVVEPPVDALYTVTQRFINGNFPYMIERMDNRIWPGVEQTWCVDCGLRLAQNAPASQIQASSAVGDGALAGIASIVGGQGYSAGTTAVVVDDNGRGPGTGATVALAIQNGVITNAIVSAPGIGYVRPRVDLVDPLETGSGAVVTPLLENTAVFTTIPPAFGGASRGDVIRMGGGIAIIVAINNPGSVIANIIVPITDVRPNTSPPLVTRQQPGAWTLTTPVATIYGLSYLAGATVTGLADGLVVTPRIVAPDGSVTLDRAASAVTLGLGFQAQFQSVYLDTGEPTVQGQRKKIAAATVRFEASRDMKIGANQVDGSTLSPPSLAPTWQDLEIVPNTKLPPFDGVAPPLFTGDVRVPLPNSWNKRGQVALQQDNPVPMQIIEIVPEVLAGDTPSQAFPQKQAGGRR